MEDFYYSQSTSCCKDDAVRYLMDELRGHVRKKEVPEDSTPEEIECGYTSLFERICLLLESVTIQLDNSKKAELPFEELNALEAELDELKGEMTQYLRYKCDIDNELAKGNASLLIVDKHATQSPSHPFITLASLDAWAKITYRQQYKNSVFDESETKINPHKVKKINQQEDAILAEISRIGYDPMSLPKYSKSHAGAKSEVRAKLQGTSLIPSPKVFDNAWANLSKQKRISYMSDTSSP